MLKNRNIFRRIKFMKKRNLARDEFEYFEGEIQELYEQHPNAFILGIEYISKNEMWTNIKGFKGMYQISNKGSVRKRTSPENYIDIVIKTDPIGYAFVIIKKSGIPKTKYIRKLIKEHFETM